MKTTKYKYLMPELSFGSKPRTFSATSMKLSNPLLRIFLINPRFFCFLQVVYLSLINFGELSLAYYYLVDMPHDFIKLSQNCI